MKVAFVDPNGSPEFWQPVCSTMRAAAARLGIDVEIRDSNSSCDRAIVIAHDFLAEHPPPDVLIATKAAHVNRILLNDDLDPRYGEPRTQYRNWLGSIVPRHEGAGYGIATEIPTEAQSLPDRPLKILALTGDATTPAAVGRVRRLERGIKVMSDLLGPNSVQLLGVRYLDGTERAAEAALREFLKSGPHIDALWAADDPMALGAIVAQRLPRIGTVDWNQGDFDRFSKSRNRSRARYDFSPDAVPSQRRVIH